MPPKVSPLTTEYTWSLLEQGDLANAPITRFVFKVKHGRFEGQPLSPHLSKALEIIFLMASVHGGQVIAIFSYTISTCHGKRKQMPGNGQLAQETSTGMFLALLRKVRLLTCNRG